MHCGLKSKHYLEILPYSGHQFCLYSVRRPSACTGEKGHEEMQRLRGKVEDLENELTRLVSVHSIYLYMYQAPHRTEAKSPNFLYGGGTNSSKFSIFWTILPSFGAECRSKYILGSG